MGWPSYTCTDCDVKPAGFGTAAGACGGFVGWTSARRGAFHTCTASESHDDGAFGDCRTAAHLQRGPVWDRGDHRNLERNGPDAKQLDSGRQIDAVGFEQRPNLFAKDE